MVLLSLTSLQAAALGSVFGDHNKTNPHFNSGPNLGTASGFALFTAAGAINNTNSTGPTVITGDVGTKEGAINGLTEAVPGPGNVNGQIYPEGSPESNQAATDVAAAYNSLNSITCGPTISSELASLTLTPGVYCQPTATPTSLNGTLTLSGSGIFIIKLNSALTTATNSNIVLINGATASNVFFQVNGAVNVGIGASFKGTILANGAISLLTGASLEGRGLSIAGAINLDNNRVEVTPLCCLSITATPTACQTATNQYTVTGTVSFTGTLASSLTITDGTASTTFSVTAGQPSATYTLAGLNSGTGLHTVTLTSSATTCGAISATYTAPASCTVAIALSVTPGSTQTATNQYDITGTLSLTNAVAGTATITDGTVSTTVAVSAGATSVPYALSGLSSGTGNHTVTATYAGLTTTAVYTAPAAFTAGAVGIALSVTPGSTQSATNQYDITGTLSLTNAVAGTATITDGTTSTTVAVSAGATSVPYALSGLSSGTGSHTVTATYAGLTTTTVYTAPAAFTATAPTLQLEQFVSQSRAVVGDVLTYSLVLTNPGSTTAATVVSSSLSSGSTYVAGSATVPAGTIFTPGSPASSWNVPSIGAGQSLTLTFQVVVNSTGILYSTASIPGDTASVCTSIPVKICVGEEFTFQLTAPPGRSSYQWSRTVNGTTTVLAGQTTNVLEVTAVGEYSLAVDNATGLCADFSCCPFIVEADSVASFSLVALAPTCQGPTSLTNGQITLSGLVSTTATTYTYQVAQGATFGGGILITPTQQALPPTGLLSNSLAAGTYTVRVYNALGCFRDVVVIVPPANCQCPADVCTPFVITQTKRAPRVGG